MCTEYISKIFSLPNGNYVCGNVQDFIQAIDNITKKYPKTVYITILGLLLATPFSIIYSGLHEYAIIFNAPTIIFSIISLLLGIGLVILSEHISKKIERK